MKPKPSPRLPTYEERRTWLDEAAERQEAPRREDLAVLRAYCQKKSPWRWRRFRSDYKHFGKIIKKLEMNPEDARWLL